MKFEYYVMNESFNNGKIEMFNIFQNCLVQERIEKEIKKYLRSPNKYKYIKNEFSKEEIVIYGFEALCEEVRRTIQWQMWSRRQYEIAVGSLFTVEISDVLRDIDKYNTLEELKEELKKINKRNRHLEKWDCYKQCELNIPMSTRECIYQYKQYIKNKKKESGIYE